MAFKINISFEDFGEIPIPAGSRNASKRNQSTEKYILDYQRGFLAEIAIYKYFKNLGFNISKPDGRRKENLHDPDLICEERELHIKSQSPFGNSWVFQNSSKTSTGICCLVGIITNEMLEGYLNNKTISIDVIGFIPLSSAKTLFKPMMSQKFNVDGPNGKRALYQDDVVEHKDFEYAF